MRMLWFNLATDLNDPILGFTTRWIQALAARAECIHTITMRAGRVEVPRNVRVYSVGKEKGHSEPRRLAMFYRHLSHILREERVDVCFSHMMPIFTILAAPVLKIKGIPIVTWYAHPSLTWPLKLAHHFSDCMVTSLATAYPYKHDKLIVVGQGIDTDLFAPDAEVVPDNPPMILCVGRLSPVKGHPTLLRTAALLRQRWEKPFRLVIVGDPAGPRDEPYVRSLQQQVKELALEGTVFFEPGVPMDCLPRWYQRCTVHVNLTPPGFGDKVAWEALACARPCLIANKAFEETLGEYAGPCLFRHGDPEDLTDRLYWALSLSETKRALIGFYFRQQVMKMHGLKRLMDRLFCVFQEVQRCHN
jgi:glycosyltransferase involved in cell wall biosynthesis